MENSFAITTTFIVYLILMLAIGVYAYQRTKNSADYFLGGRSLGPWPAALSAGASDMSGWLLLGLPGYAYAAGIESFWLAGGLLVGTWANWLVNAKRLRTYSITTDSLTLPEFLSRRFNDNSKLIQTISAFFILLFFLFYTSSGLVAGGKLFETVFGLDYSTAVIIGTVCVVSYTLFGGFLAVSWTDLVQGLLMAAALMIVPIAAMNGGFTQLNHDLAAINPELLTLWNDAKGEPLSAIAIISLVAWGLGYFGQPHILARFKASRSNKDLITARRIAVVWTGLSMAGAILVGLTGLIFVTQSGTIGLDDGEKNLHAISELAVPPSHRRYFAGRHFGGNHEYCGFAAAGLFIGTRGRFLQASVQNRCQLRRHCPRWSHRGDFDLADCPVFGDDAR